MLKSQDGKGSFDHPSLPWRWGSSRSSRWGQVTSETLPSPSRSSCSPCLGTSPLSLVSTSWSLKTCFGVMLSAVGPMAGQEQEGAGVAVPSAPHVQQGFAEDIGICVPLE